MKTFLSTNAPCSFAYHEFCLIFRFGPLGFGIRAEFPLLISHSYSCLCSDLIWCSDRSFGARGLTFGQELEDGSEGEGKEPHDDIYEVLARFQKQDLPGDSVVHDRHRNAFCDNALTQLHSRQHRYRVISNNPHDHTPAVPLANTRWLQSAIGMSNPEP